jgi:hypothetical protein
MTLYRFGRLLDDGARVAHDHGDRFYRELTTGPERLVLGPARGHVELLRALSRELAGPFFLLHVLLVPRAGQREGRYQSAQSLTHEELEAFLTSFGEYLERDGRHHLWVKSVGADDSLLVHDNHGLLYAYGELEDFERLARARGMVEEEFSLPVPHVHSYHPEFDSEERRLLAVREWLHFPLQPGDDP